MVKYRPLSKASSFLLHVQRRAASCLQIRSDDRSLACCREVQTEITIRRSHAHRSVSIARTTSNVLREGEKKRGRSAVVVVDAIPAKRAKNAPVIPVVSALPVNKAKNGEKVPMAVTLDDEFDF